MKLKNFAEAREVLKGYVPAETKEVYTLDNMKKLMAAFENPQNRLQIIHVAGTSGKTSTAYYIAALLKAAGQKVGLTVSPHIDEVNERVQIDLKPLREDKFCKALGQFIDEVTAKKLKPTYFELMVAFAYWYFATQQLDYVVVEVGLGGLLDGTNVIDRADKVCVITDIGFDHTDVLGNTLKDIAAQKAGIIQPKNIVIMFEQDPAVMTTVNGIATKHQAMLEIVPTQTEAVSFPDTMPLFQRRNWSLAKAVFDYVLMRDHLEGLTPMQFVQTMETYVPARMEVIDHGNKTIVLDGAHNAQKMSVLVESMNQRFADKTIAVLLTLGSTKDFMLKGDLKVIAGLADHIILTSFKGQQDFPKESVDPKRLADECKRLGYEDFEVVAKPEEAFKKLLKRPEEVLLVTGSFYLMNHIRPLILDKGSP